jgi:hypothetical protein
MVAGQGLFNQICLSKKGLRLISESIFSCLKFVSERIPKVEKTVPTPRQGGATGYPVLLLQLEQTGRYWYDRRIQHPHQLTTSFLIPNSFCLYVRNWQAIHLPMLPSHSQ